MLIEKTGQAGTVESNDALITVAPAKQGDGIKIDLESPTIQQYGHQIKAVIREVLQCYQITDAMVVVNDRGVLDCTIRARINTAIERAMTTVQ
ncbi:citrate lyase acyl carrier protein [bacterium BFN5]|nr:citrate lyase acyl carrier protein [bacterium BFN5]QJW47252.1 citrate lyase acyl carrier protein [bacterium BFN5]